MQSDLPQEYYTQVVPRTSPLYYSLMFTPQPQRQAIIALHALKNELCKITEHYREKSIAQSKLRWWQQEWQNTFKGNPNHPITRLLGHAITTWHLPTALFEEWIDGALLKLDSDHLCTTQDLELFCYREYGICALLCTYILTVPHAQTLRSIQNIAASIEQVRLISHLRHHLQRGLCYIPLDWLQAAQISDADLNPVGPVTPALKTVLTQWWEKILASTQQAKSLIIADKATLSPLLIQEKLAIKLGREVANAGFPVFLHQTTLTPINCFFTAVVGFVKG